MLRLAELFVFGLPAAFFVLKEYHEITTAVNLADGRAFVPMLVGPWLLVIFTYAMFIPNTWQRALLVLALVGTFPVALLLYMTFTVPAFDQVLSRPEYEGFISGQVMFLGIAVLVGTVGVQTIGTLRREAFAAKQLGQYLLKQRLGGGGMGEVYLAEHRMMKRPCAVKIIRPEKAGDPQALARFEREVRATATLSHWNSIDIYDYGRTGDGTFYYVMEFLPGHNIGEIVDDYGPFSAGRTVYLMEQVCAALAEAHGIGLVHRPKGFKGFAASHDKVTEVYQVLEGSGTLVTGGTMVNPQRRENVAEVVTQINGPGVSGASIQGGVSRRIAKGDMVIIPAGTPHWFSEVQESITYTVVRVDPGRVVKLK